MARVSKKMLQVRVKKALNCSRLLSVIRGHHDLHFWSLGGALKVTISSPRGGSLANFRGCNQAYHIACRWRKEGYRCNPCGGG